MYLEKMYTLQLLETLYGQILCIEFGSFLHDTALIRSMVYINSFSAAESDIFIKQGN
jgi:hypothetical protein